MEARHRNSRLSFLAWVVILRGRLNNLLLGLDWKAAAVFLFSYSPQALSLCFCKIVICIFALEMTRIWFVHMVLVEFSSFIRFVVSSKMAQLYLLNYKALKCQPAQLLDRRSYLLQCLLSFWIDCRCCCTFFKLKVLVSMSVVYHILCNFCVKFDSEWQT